MTDPPVDHDSLADLAGELRYLLNRWDPIGIYDEEHDFPPDEYDCLIGPILTRLARGRQFGVSGRPPVCACEGWKRE